MPATASLSATPIPDHTARFHQRHVARMRDVLLMVLRLCRDGGLVRLGLVAREGPKVGATPPPSSLDEQVSRMVAGAEAADTQEDRQFVAQRGDELAVL